MSESEVARIRSLIEAEYQAMLRGLTGLAEGDAKREFIRAHMDQVTCYQRQLAQIVSDVQAALIVGNAYAKVAKEEKSNNHE